MLKRIVRKTVFFTRYFTKMSSLPTICVCGGGSGSHVTAGKKIFLKKKKKIKKKKIRKRISRRKGL